MVAVRDGGRSLAGAAESSTEAYGPIAQDRPLAGQGARAVTAGVPIRLHGRPAAREDAAASGGPTWGGRGKP
jgi:hypothetical protein